MSALQTAQVFAGASLPGALVSRVDPFAHESRYLQITPAGALQWVSAPEAATPFESMREAMRMATRLPAAQRAFGIPCEPNGRPVH